MASLSFARIINPVCSCGMYVGQLQHEIEFRLIEIGGGDSDDTDVVKILDEMNIKRMCCRSTIIISPVLRLMKTQHDLNIYTDQKVIRKSMERITINNPNSPRI